MLHFWRISSLISTLFTGLIVGIIACMIMGDDRGSWVKYIVIGIVGSAIGSFICSAVGIYAYGRIASLAISIAGSCVLIWLIDKMGYR